MVILRRCMLLSFLLVSWPCIAAEAHVHGVATLQIAVDGKTLQLNLESPLHSLLGFEHAPRTEKQKAAVMEMENQLRQAGRLFRPTAAAGCSLKSVKLDSLVLASDQSPEHGVHDHADLDGEFIFECAHPNELRDIEVKIFDAFPGLKSLKTEAATPRGQRAATLTAAKRRIDW